MVDGKYFTVDAHCHIYPKKIARAAIEGTDSFYGEKSVCEGTVEDLLQRGISAGTDRFVVQSVATTKKQVRSINSFIAEQVSLYPDRLTGLGTLHPESDDIKGDLEQIVSLGLHGVKLHPDIQQFKIDDYRCLKIYELCEEKGLPILMHTGDSRFDFSNPNRLLPVMKIYTSLTVVAAHLGGWSVWEEAEEKLKGLPNLYFDCSSCFQFISAKRVEEIIKTFGTDRVLYGTDYPMWSPKDEIENLLSLSLTEKEKKQMLGENASKVFAIA